MPWSLNINQQLQIVEVAYVGKITACDLQESTSECIRLEKDEGINRFLIETSAVELQTPLYDLYRLPNIQYVEEQADREGRVAVMLPTSDRERQAAKFYETMCFIRGWDVLTFVKRQSAVRWLKRGLSSNKMYPGDSV